SSRRRHTRFARDWSSDVCSSDLIGGWDAPLGIELRVDGLASALLFAFAIVTALVILHVGSRWRPGKSRRHFLALTLFALAALDRSEERRVGRDGRTRVVPLERRP